MKMHMFKPPGIPREIHAGNVVWYRDSEKKHKKKKKKKKEGKKQQQKKRRMMEDPGVG